MVDKRNFVIESAEIELPEGYKGHFESRAPWNAAVKATRRLFAILDESKQTKGKKGKKAPTMVRFVLREITRGGEGKSYHYIGSKVKLEEPIEYERAGAKFVVQYKYTAKACK